MATIAFLHPVSDYCGSMLGKEGVRGVQNTTIILAECLAARGHYVEGITGFQGVEEHNGVIWSAKPGKEHYDLAVANLYPRYLDLVSAKRKCVWVHNPMNRWSRFKKSIRGLIKHRPEAVFVTDYQIHTTPAIFPFSKRHVIEHGIEEFFLNAERKGTAPEPVAIFTSQGGRNLDSVINMWKQVIHPKLEAAQLHLYCSLPDNLISKDLAEFNIIHKGLVPQKQLIQAYSDSRVMFYPGHSEETFCNVAHEAVICGLPVVTMGIGGIRDRIQNGKNGIIVKTRQEMAEAALKILQDDQEWLRLHEAAITETQYHTWKNRAELWEKIFLES
ncbi:MAG: glycosyltransferase family 4 protein [Methyloligellaceae bacterium]